QAGGEPARGWRLGGRGGPAQPRRGGGADVPQRARGTCQVAVRLRQGRGGGGGFRLDHRAEPGRRLRAIRPRARRRADRPPAGGSGAPRPGRGHAAGHQPLLDRAAWCPGGARGEPEVSPPVLRGSADPLAARYDVALLDLDGVVYRGAEAVPDAAAALGKAGQAGMRRVFVPNNAARSPQAVADHLRRLGVPAEPADVITSAQTGAHVLAERLPAGAKVLVVGTASLADEVTARGLTVASTAAEN